jgi:hypothetical protein
MTKEDECAKLIFEFFKKEPYKAILWFTENNSAFGGLAPIVLIRMGRTHKVLLFIKGCLQEKS